MADPAALKAIMTSKEYQNLSPEKRRALQEVLPNLKPEELQELAAGLGGADVGMIEPARQGAGHLVNRGPLSRRQQGESLAPALIDIAGQAGGAALGSFGGPLGVAVGEAGGSYLANQANKALGLREGKPFSFPDMGDILSVGIPLGFRALTGFGRGTTKPAREALASADAENLSNQQAFQTKKTQAIAKGNTALAEAKIAADDVNTARWQKFHEEVQKEKDRFLQARENLEIQTGLSNEQRAQAHKDLIKEYHESLKAHQKAVQDIPAQGKQNISPGNYRENYQLAAEAAARASGVDVAPLRETASSLGLQFDLPAEAVQNHRMKRILNAFEGWGVAKEGPEMDSAIAAQLRNRGRAPAQAPPATMPIERVIATHQKLGQVVGQTAGRGGEEWGAAKKLYAEVSDLLETQAGKDPNAKTAITEYLAGQKAWRQEQALLDWDELFLPGHHGNQQISRDTLQLNKTGILTGFKKLLNDDKFFRGSFTPSQLQQMEVALDKLPSRIPRVPGNAPTPVSPDYSKIRPPKEIPTPERVEPDFSKATSPWPGAPPATVEPDPIKFPFGRFILARILGGNAGAAVGGQQGSNFLAGLIGGAVAVLPETVSRVLLSHPMGEQIVRNIMAGKRTIGPNELAALTAAAKALEADRKQ